MPAALSARGAYRRWHAAAGPWAGFVRAVPLVALARGIIPRPASVPPPPAALLDALAETGAREGWLGRPDVLLLLDLPGAMSVAVAAGLADHGVRPVLLVFLWPEPRAIIPSEDVLAALLQHAPHVPRKQPPDHGPAQYAFLLGRERTGPATPADLATRFDNRYELGTVDLPTAERLRAGGIAAVVACRHAASPPAPDLTDYLDTLEAAGVPVRRLALD